MDEQEDPGCYFHGEEAIPEKYYIVCGECGHCYLTAEELLTKMNDFLYEGWFKYEQGTSPWIPYISADDIYHCAYCAHDF